MTAPGILAQATAAGLTLTLHAPDCLRVTGPAVARARLLPEIRANKPALVALLSEGLTPDLPRRLWLITHPDGRLVSHSFTPEAALAQVRGWYPDALGIQPEGPPAPYVEQPLDVAEEQALNAWLDHIGETDASLRAETLERCQADPKVRTYFLGRATEAERPA